MLSDTRVKQAKPRGAPYKLTDGGGLYLYVSPAAAKSWRYDYRFNGRRRTVAFGLYLRRLATASWCSSKTELSCKESSLRNNSTRSSS